MTVFYMFCEDKRVYGLCAGRKYTILPAAKNTFTVQQAVYVLLLIKGVLGGEGGEGVSVCS